MIAEHDALAGAKRRQHCPAPARESDADRLVDLRRQALLRQRSDDEVALQLSRCLERQHLQRAAAADAEMPAERARRARRSARGSRRSSPARHRARSRRARREARRAHRAARPAPCTIPSPRWPSVSIVTISAIRRKASLRAPSRNSRLPEPPAIGEGRRPTTLPAACSSLEPRRRYLSRSACRGATSGSRTMPPLPSAFRPTSNCGLTRKTPQAPGSARPSAGGSASFSEMKLRSATTAPIFRPPRCSLLQIAGVQILRSA